MVWVVGVLKVRLVQEVRLVKEVEGEEGEFRRMVVRVSGQRDDSSPDEEYLYESY